MVKSSDLGPLEIHDVANLEVFKDWAMSESGCHDQNLGGNRHVHGWSVTCGVWTMLNHMVSSLNDNGTQIKTLEMNTIMYELWLSMIIYDYLWLSVIIYDYLWLSMVICDYLWLSMVIYD